MKNCIEHIIDKETFFRIMKNVPSSSYIRCAKCHATKIDATELLKFIEKIVDQYYSSDYDEYVYEELSEIMSNILEFGPERLTYYELHGIPDIMDNLLDIEPRDLAQEGLLKWYIENKKRLYNQDEEGRLQYLVCDSVIFYQNIECECFLKKNIDQESVYSVEVDDFL